MRHAALEKLCTLDGGFSGADGEQRATILETHLPDKMVCRYWTPGNTVGDVTVIKIPQDALSQAPQLSFPYL